MKKRVHIASTRSGIRRFKSKMEDPRVRQEIGAAGGAVVLKAAQAVSPVGDRNITRYAKRTVKGKRNKTAQILGVTPRGNLRDAHTIESTAAGVAVGPREKKGNGSYAYYAPMVHAINPWLKMAMRRASANAQRIMTQKLYRLVNQLSV